MNVSGRMASVFALQDWKDVGTTPTWVREMQSGGTNLPAAELGVTRWFESKCSDTGEGAVKKLEHRFKFQGKYLRLEKRRAGGTPERGGSLGRSARSRRVRAAPGFTQHIRHRAKHLVKQYEHGLIR